MWSIFDHSRYFSRPSFGVFSVARPVPGCACSALARRSMSSSRFICLKQFLTDCVLAFCLLLQCACSRRWRRRRPYARTSPWCECVPNANASRRIICCPAFPIIRPTSTLHSVPAPTVPSAFVPLPLLPLDFGSYTEITSTWSPTIHSYSRHSNTGTASHLPNKN